MHRVYRSSYRPYGTGRVFGRIPGNKLPGYHHSVPSGTKTVEACPPNRLHPNLPARELSTTRTRTKRLAISPKTVLLELSLQRGPRNPKAFRHLHQLPPTPAQPPFAPTPPPS